MICPNCGTDLEGEVVYDYFLKRTGNEEEAARHAVMFGATKENKKCFSNVIGIYSLESDRTTAFMCPECQYVWDRQ